MESPIREKIRLDGWQARPVNGRTASVFVPGPWNDKRVVLKPGSSPAWSTAQIGNTELTREQGEDAWKASPALRPGHWNTVTTDGDTPGSRLEASAPLHITALEGRAANQKSLAVRVRLNGPEETQPGLLTIVFSLTSVIGRLAGGTEVTVSSRTRDLSVELPLPDSRGLYRLKAALCAGDRVIDNARIDVQV